MWCDILYRVSFPCFIQVEDIALNAAVAILTAEDARLGLKNANVGQWPKLVAGNLLSTSLAGEYLLWKPSNDGDLE